MSRQGIKDIITKAENDIKQRYGTSVRLSADYLLPKSADEVLSVFFERWGIHHADLFTSSKKVELVAMRHIVMLYLNEECRMGPSAIGRYLGVDHTTVIHGLRKAANYIRLQDSLFIFYFNQVKDFFDEKI